MSDDLDNYRITGDDPTGGHPTVALTCDTCSNNLIGAGDIRTWDTNDYVPSITDLINEARRHERTGHTQP